SVDRDGRVTSLNPAGEALLGWSEAELLGKSVHDAVHFQRADGSRVPAADCPLLAAARSGVPDRNAEDIFTRKDGTRFPVAYTSAPIERCGRVEGAVIAFRDMSERKEAEARQARRARLTALRAKVAAALAEAGELRGV